MFRECDRRFEFVCAPFYVPNKLVFGDRKWKVDFLRRAMSAERKEEDIEFDGFHLWFARSTAYYYAMMLGLTELAPQMEDVFSSCPDFRRGTWDVCFELYGTSSGNEHPGLVAARRLEAMGPEEIVRRILSDDEGFQVFLVGLPRRLTTYDYKFYTEERTEYIDAVMRPLTAAFRWYLDSLPEDLVKGWADYDQATKKLRYFLSGGCDSGVSVELRAFPAVPQKIAVEKERLKRLKDRFGPRKSSVPGPR